MRVPTGPARGYQAGGLAAGGRGPPAHAREATHRVAARFRLANAHLHRFQGKDGTVYNAPEARRFDADYGTDGDRPPIDERRVLLSDVFDRVKKTITYEYDFGDAWVHAVRLECVVRRESVVLPGGAVVGPERAAVCVAGERNCPPEDCGGIGGYHDILGVIAMTKSGIELIEKEDNDLLVWLGEWEQENFNQAGASRLLGRVRLRKTLQK